MVRFCSWYWWQCPVPKQLPQVSFSVNNMNNKIKALKKDLSRCYHGRPPCQSRHHHWPPKGRGGASPCRWRGGRGTPCQTAQRGPTYYGDKENIFNCSTLLKFRFFACISWTDASNMFTVSPSKASCCWEAACGVHTLKSDLIALGSIWLTLQTRKVETKAKKVSLLILLA